MNDIKNLFINNGKIMNYMIIDRYIDLLYKYLYIIYRNVFEFES